MDKLTVYRTIKTIKATESKKIELVYHEIDHCCYIKRELSQYDLDTYQRLKEHPNPGFVRVMDLWVQDEKLIVIEEFINGLTLDNVLMNEELNKEQIIGIMDDLCDTLSFLHQLYPPIIHRDIKPENIFYYRGHAILFDFDISRVYDYMKNKDTQVMGSVGYAAPEQFGFSQSDSRSDIYALGVLLNVLFTKQLPQDELYGGEESKIILKATALDPQRRYQKVEQLKQALHHYHPDAFLDEHKKYGIPGFRHKKISHMIAAIVYYTASLFLAMHITVVNGTSNEQLASKVSFSIWFLFIPLLVFDFMGLRKTALFSQCKNKIMIVIGLVLTAVFWLFVIMMAAFSLT
ncbi:serine/threonine protein kinase [Beduini massiliensis]|uniref:serine/threonine protein kinase n=1 Tax=Beduini massiliensis TaxID=1585974 RepID=UPI000694A5D5|nr:protein kinase [Beduini massiliensis]